MFCEEILGAQMVLFDVGEQFLQPWCAMRICGLSGCKTECIRFIVAGGMQLFFEAVAQMFILDEDVGDLQTRKVECLAR